MPARVQQEGSSAGSPGMKESLLSRSPQLPRVVGLRDPLQAEAGEYRQYAPPVYLFIY